MADTAKHRNINNSANNGRKSKNEIIRSALGSYLKQRNYSNSEKFRKSDLALLQSNKQMEFGSMLDDDVSKVNSFLYSNVLCLNKDSNVVEQFAKFQQFVQSQPLPYKNELEVILRPLLCHLYIELLKGKDSSVALEFLKKFADGVIGPVESIANPLPNKINGSSLTQITFFNETDNENSTQQYFKELVQLMSQCLRIEDLDHMELTRNFRYSKYEIELSLQSLFALKHFLVKNGHVLLLHVLQTWFWFDVTDARDSDDDDICMVGERPENGTEDESCENESDGGCQSVMSIKIKEVSERLVKTENEDESEKVKKVLEADLMAKKRITHKLKHLRRTVLEMKTHEQPVRVFKVENGTSRLASATIDPAQCHLAGGFEDSTIQLFQLNRSTIGGRKPYMSITKRCCQWSLENSSEISSDDDDDDTDTKYKYCKPGTSKTEQRRKLAEQRSTENIFTESGCVALRGHNKGVTDLVFSKEHPLLFSASKDNTMRAWKATDYSCGAVYRGHNYPIWCVAESSVGMYLATGSKDLTARLWSTDREYPLQTYIGHTQDVDAVAFHPNGNYLATGSTDLTVRLWCVTSGKLFRVFTDCHLPVHCVSFSPDGKLLAAAGEESKIRIFDLAAGSQLCELKEHTTPVCDIVWSQFGNRLASTCSDGTVRVFNVNNKTVSSSSINPSSSSSSSTASSSNNKLLYSYVSGCKRSVKVFFNSDGSVSCIGHS
ncbi:TAF5-like RNA polymerase II p300/CBP-associated factor-associated factor 65 kDa subunit 5L isoform X1 [Bradysia coprophila]|uniref:TAF5-like RNA polymerase II p300/CBP-associated factor-associated factor 65 kDa subunit 5L isoform X1 n=1 Tax=Bradysia coprophila TaxID=38358 RepID=UPI00187DA194|nr:TAF5-like RNA polymerase II p300/CBP-associated factor-associated factor 65 kDa subunit 5L isoform X1 [Bradysia coprophila]XP_037037146.1 TAF5-like RNA polymerase II p300/CBP-associated factor-associated factor 65 kDa subunit 5L isoform X1 [Bradysia coprophila]